MLASSISSVLSFCSDEGFKPCSLELENIDTGIRETLDMHSGRLSAKHRASEFVHENDKALLIKDKCAIGNSV